MARTTINTQVIPDGTIVSADLSYPLTDFSSTGIDDNATSTAITIDSSGNIAVTGTVDGRDLATDGTKLDGIAASATNYGDSDVATYISGNRSYGNITTTGYIAGPSTFTIDPAAVGDNTGTLVIAGNLQVDGTTTTINSTTMTVDDLNITLASGAANAAAANGAGITVDGASATLTYNSTPDAWSFNKNVGIGTDDPDTYSLGVGRIVTSYSNSGNLYGLFTAVGSGTGGGEIDFGNQTVRHAAIASLNGSDLSFYTNPNDSGTTVTKRMTIDSSGNVGIGTDSPYDSSWGSNAKALAISGTEYGVLHLIDTGGPTRYSIGAGDGKLYLAYDDVAAAHRIVVDNSGKVGIGATSIDGQLHVKGTTNRTVKIDPTFSSGTWTSLAFARNGTDLWRTFQNSSDQYLSFYNDQSSLYQLTLRNTGYVGINQLNPFSPLHIDKITETVNYTSTNFNSQPTITLVHSNTNGQYNGIRYTNTAGNYEWFTGTVQTGVNYADFVFQGYNRYTSAYQEHVRITEKGRIGIGDGNPETPLHIKITNKLGSTFTGSTRGEGITVEQTNYSSGNYISLIEAPYNDDGNPTVRIGSKFTGSGSSIVMGTSNAYATGITNQSFEMDPSGFTVLGNTANGAFTQLHVHALQSNYGPITARSNSYTTIWSILPWSSGITYMSSGVYYANGSWVHQSSSAHNCLLGTSGDAGIRWYASSNSSPSWNLATDVQLFNSSGQLTASSASDERLKENIVDYTIADALTKVNALRPVSFEWNDTIKRKKGTEYADGTHVGFIAQEVETVFPEACLISDTDRYDAESAFDLDPDDTYYGDIKGVRAEKMVPILVGAIKELTRRLEILENA